MRIMACAAAILLLLAGTVHGQNTTRHKFELPSLAGKYSSAKFGTYKMHRIGSVQIIGKVRYALPAYGFYVQTDMGGFLPPVVYAQNSQDPQKPDLSNLIRFNLTRVQAAGLVAHFTSSTGLFLAPKGWGPAEAFTLLQGQQPRIMMVPGDPKPGAGQWMYYTGTGAGECLSLGVAVQWFSRWRRDARAQGERAGCPAYQTEHDGYREFDVPITIVLLAPNIAAFSYRGRNERYMTHGIAFYSLEHPPTFLETVYVTLPPEQKSLATAILNFWLLPAEKRWPRPL